MLNPFREIAEYFDFVDATPADYAGAYQFCIPNTKAYARWPAWPAAARPENGRAAAGRGWSAEACVVSGLGEAVELASVCAWGDEDLIRASQASLGPSAIGANAVLGYRPDELSARRAWNADTVSELDWRPNPHDPDALIDWVAFTDSTGSGVFVPADLVFVGRRARGDINAVAIATTSGCAAGQSVPDATQRALRELYERDAVGLWWYGGQPPSPLCCETTLTDPDLIRHLDQRGRTTTLFEISTDVFRHVVAAVSWDARGKAVGLGFGAHSNQSTAAQSAVIELFQTEIGLLQRAQTNDALTDLWLKEADCHLPQFTITTQTRPALCAQPPVYFTFAHTRPEFEIPVVRAICPGLATDKPRLGSIRYEHCAMPSTLPLLV